MLALLCVCSIALGARIVGIDEVLAGLRGDASTVDSAAVVKRVPRTVLAVLVGAALALSGATMQAITRNPLAEPGILGVSTGAALAVVMGLSFFGLHRPFALMALAIAGAAVAAVAVYVIGGLGQRGVSASSRSPFALALAGAACGAAFVSLTNAIMLPRVDLLRTFQFWRVGSVGGASWESIGVLLPGLLVGAVLCALLARGMNALALGDDVATGLGESVMRTRTFAGIAAVVLCGAATAVAGPIGFVGLLVPHVCRALFGPDHRWLLPLSALGGALLLVAADVTGRLITRPADVEVGVVTALIGAPFLIWIVRRTRVGSL
ncbi:ABC-type Fe3+-siderophore transport system, permease component [Leucobacter sp. 7(1)]|nr:ABC-type Fe3+-siderophore transport system, permease component [Leucobacter sp. 7(1)]